MSIPTNSAVINDHTLKRKEGKTHGIPAKSHACGLKTPIPARQLTPTDQISHAWLKNVSYYSLNWHIFQKYVNLNRREKRKVHIKRVNDDTFPEISDFWRKDTGNVWSIIIFLITSKLFRGTSSEIFGHHRNSSHFFGNLRIMVVSSSKILESQDINLTLWS